MRLETDSRPSITFLMVRSLVLSRGVGRIFQRGDHHPGIADYIWFIPLLSLVYSGLSRIIAA